MDPLDRHIAGDLSDETARIGEAKLDGEVAARLYIVAEAVLLEQALDEAAACLERFRRFKKRRDVEGMIDAILAGKVKRTHHGGGVLTLGNEEADGGARIDMFQDLRAHHELAPGGRLLEEKISEIDRSHRRGLRHLGELAEGETAKVAIFRFEVEIARENGADLSRVDPQVDACRAKLQGIDFGAQHHEGGGRLVRRCRILDQGADRGE